MTRLLADAVTERPRLSKKEGGKSASGPFLGAGTSRGCHDALAVNPALGEAEGEADFF